MFLPLEATVSAVFGWIALSLLQHGIKGMLLRVLSCQLRAE